jgi:transglutaminase superfamily protein
VGLALLLVLVAAGVVYRLLPLPERMMARRAALRVVGEAAAVALRVHDPWRGQAGVTPGGLPDRAFLAAPPPDTVSAAGRGADGRRVIARVTGWSSAGTPTIPPFEFEHWDDPALADLRRAYDLERLVRREEPDYPSLVAASAWVAGRWRPGANAPPLATSFDAREILRRAERGEVFDCGTYAWTLIQVLAALGINARLVELEGPDGGGHTVVEAWCDDRDKWIVLDPYLDATYVAGGVPLNALDLHRIRRAGREREVRIVPSSVDAHAVGRADARRPDVIPYFEHFNVRMRNNVRSARYPRWHPKANRIMSGYEWAGDGHGRPFFRRAVRDSAQLYFELEATALRWQWESRDSMSAPILAIRLASCTPNFDTYLVSRDGRHWTATGATLRMAPHPGRDTLRFAARNRGGRVGRVSWLALETEPLPEPARAARLPLASVGGRP